MMNIGDIRYLALEGGGGKGVAYLGPIKVLEEQGLIPLGNVNSEDNPQIKGIAGSSAGAITTLLLAIGMNSDEIAAEVNAEEGGFGDFMDEPHSGVYKAIYPNPKKPEEPIVGYGVDKLSYDKNFLPAKMVAKVGGYLCETVEEAESKGLYLKRERKKNERNLLIPSIAIKKLLLTSPTNPAVKRMVSGGNREFHDYLTNLLYDRGVFPGIAVREYFVELMARYLPKNYPEYFPNGPEALEDNKKICSTLGFGKLNKITGLQLKISSVNNTLSKPVYFSDERTPNFPVAEAVAMAMAIPGAFKPIYNSFIDMGAEEDTSKVNNRNSDYHGFFVDGGTIRNLPIHAFDQANNRAINPGVFGIRLTGGLHPDDEINQIRGELEKIYTEEGLDKELLIQGLIESGLYKKDRKDKYYIDYLSFMKSPLAEWIGGIFSSLMYYSEQGQIRTPEENQQVLELYSYTVGVFDFTPNSGEKRFVKEKAEELTRNFIKL